MAAQIMGLQHDGALKTIVTLDRHNLISPSFMWFRLTWFDRHLGLMLGLPQTTAHISTATTESSKHNDKLDGLQVRLTVILSRILVLRESPVKPDNDAFAELQDIDLELQNAADEMPKKWWLVPNLASVGNDPGGAIGDMMRLIEQTFYFNVVNMLHLPYMLRLDAPDGIMDTALSEYS